MQLTFAILVAVSYVTGVIAIEGSGGMVDGDMDCQCDCACPEGTAAACDCQCACPKPTACAKGFARVCPQTDGACPDGYTPLCPPEVDMEMEREDNQIDMEMDREDNETAADEMPWFIEEEGNGEDEVHWNIEEGEEEDTRVSGEKVKGVKVKCGKKTQTCTFTVNYSNDCKKATKVTPSCTPKSRSIKCSKGVSISFKTAKKCTISGKYKNTGTKQSVSSLSIKGVPTTTTKKTTKTTTTTTPTPTTTTTAEEVVGCQCIPEFVTFIGAAALSLGEAGGRSGMLSRAANSECVCLPNNLVAPGGR